MQGGRSRRKRSADKTYAIPLATDGAPGEVGDGGGQAHDGPDEAGHLADAKMLWWGVQIIGVWGESRGGNRVMHSGRSCGRKAGMDMCEASRLTKDDDDGPDLYKL